MVSETRLKCLEKTKYQVQNTPKGCPLLVRWEGGGMASMDPLNPLLGSSSWETDNQLNSICFVVILIY